MPNKYEDIDSVSIYQLRSSVRCYKCDNFGHYARECTNNNNKACNKDYNNNNTNKNNNLLPKKNNSQTTSTTIPTNGANNVVKGYRVSVNQMSTVHGTCKIGDTKANRRIGESAIDAKLLKDKEGIEPTKYRVLWLMDQRHRF